jgi:hypothetical protein
VSGQRGPGTEPTRSVAFAVTAHGLGHLTRACQLAASMCELCPELYVHFWTTIDRQRVSDDFPYPFDHSARSYEPGTSQRSCFEIDAPETIRAYETYLQQRPQLLVREREWIRASGCEAVVCDVPGLAVRAAAEEGIPSIAVSNFTWDWLLEPILANSSAAPVLDLLREDYASGLHHIRLPLGPEDSPFPSSESGPLVSRRASLPPDRVRGQLGLDPLGDKPVALVCPGGWEPEGWHQIRPDTEGFDLILVGDLPVNRRTDDVNLGHNLPAPIRFPDLVNAADVVLAKPGYGIASECVTHRTPLVTIDRPGFRETEILRRELAKLGRSGEISLGDFFEGRWTRVLEQVLSSSTPWAALPDRPDRLAAKQVFSALGWA